MSSCSTGPTCPLVLSVIDDTNYIRGTDFGFPKGEWVWGQVYMAEPAPNVGVVVFLPGVGQQWAITFFPVWPEAVQRGIPLNVIFAEYTLACATGKIGPRPENTRQVLATEIIEIICIIQDRTIGEDNVCSYFQSVIDRVLYAELERETRRDCAVGYRSENVG